MVPHFIYFFNMSRIKYFYFSLILAGCIEPINIPGNQDSGLLVVDGLVHNEKAPYTIRLSYSKSYDGFTNLPETGANVYVIDSAGHEYIFEESDDGTYISDPLEFTGEINNFYTLVIETRAGKLYQSNPEKLHPTPPIDCVYYEYKEEIDYIGDFSQQIRNYFQIYVAVKDPVYQQNFYRWRTSRVMEFTSTWAGVPPPPCCFKCYLYYFNQEEVAVANDHQINGQWLTHQPITKVGNGYSNPFSVRVTQYSLSKKAYEYWSNIQEQHENTGSIFDTPPANIRGNIYNKEDKSELVLGYFMASAITRDTLYVPRYSYSKIGRVKFEVEGDCRQVEGASAEIPPEFR